MTLAAQTTPPNPPNPELTALQNQLNALNLQLQTITVQNQILAAKVGAPAVTPVQPLAGNITQQDDKSFPEATALAYNAMRADARLIYNRIDAAIASPVHQDKNIALVIYDQASLTGVQQYLAFKPQLALQRESLCFAVAAARLEASQKLLLGSAPVEAGITGATNLVSSVATLMAMFRTDVDRRSTDVTIDDLSLVQEVGNIYKSKRSLPNPGALYNTRVFLPSQYFMPDEVDQSELKKIFELKDSDVFNESAGVCKKDAPVGFYAGMAELAVIRDLANEVYAQSSAPFQKLTDADSKLKADKSALQLLRAKPSDKLSDDEKVQLKILPDEVSKDQEALTTAKHAIDKTGNDNAIEKKRQQVADLKSQLDRYDTLVKALGTVDSTGTTPLAKYASADRLSRYLQSPNTYLLNVKVLKSSAANQTKKSLFLGTRLYFSGACTASFLLIDSSTSDVVSSGSFTTVTNYMREKTFKQKFGTDVVQSLPPAATSSRAHR
jgi:hypothetical protein